MNDHNETTANTPSEPKLCKMGCGFFGINATGDCCSKCWNTLQQKEGATVAAPQPAPTNPPPPVTQLAPATTPSPMVCEPVKATEGAFAKTDAAASPVKKKKKKKTSYKNMIAGMMEGSGSRDIEKEKEGLRKVTGGGEFSKIEKI